MSRILGAGVALALMLGSGAAVAQMYGGGYGPTASNGPTPTAPSFNPADEYNKGREALKAHKYKEAITAFNRVLSVVPHDSNTWALLGLSKEGAGDLKGARDAYDKAVRYKPDSLVAHQLLGVAEAKLGNAAKAQAQIGWLKKQMDACGACSNASDIKAAIAAIEAAMAPASAPASAPATPASAPASH